MAKRVQRYRVSGLSMATLVGKLGELIVNLTNNSVHLHDGVTAGGFELARADVANVQNATSSQAGRMTAAQVQELTNATAAIAAETAARIAAVSAVDAAKVNIIASPTVGRAVAVASGGQLSQQAPQFGTYSGNPKLDALEAGTRLAFNQAAAPVGWTKETGAAYNDVALRVVTGTGGATGGTNAFSTVMAQTVVGDTTLTAAQSGLPSHTHSYTGKTTNTGDSGSGVNTPQNVTGQTTGATGGSSATAAHNHSLTMSMKYTDIIICAKDA